MSQAASLVSIHRIVWIALMAALTAVGGMIAIPVGPLSPVPITLQTMFVLLAGLILGPRGGALAMVLYMAAGSLGLPVFAGGKAGLAVFLGPTGGFLLGFVPAAVFCGFARKDPLRSFGVILAFCAFATLITLVLGTLQLAAVLQVSISKAVAVGVVPFLPGAVVKCLGATFIYRFLAARRLIPV
ncbi:biotin transporter BioY [Desulfovibrio sp. OttesenSCG-928-O18]|nr:biotin transporter BioY [Desulfovibrio sp. OttesenSCG-928-O18]